MLGISPSPRNASRGIVFWAIILLQVIVKWPCWFVAHWFGVPSIIAIIDGNGIQEIAESAAGGYNVAEEDVTRRPDLAVTTSRR